MSGEFLLMALAVLLLQVSYVFDCSDGIVARYSGLSSSFGAYLDVLLDRVGGALFMLSVFYCSIMLFELENPALVGFSLLVCFFYHLSSSFRPYYFPQLKGYMKSDSKVTLPKLFVKFSYEFIDTGIFYLILSTSILASVIEPVAYFYGVIGSLLLVGNMVVLYRADNNG
jgi:phosphatidylglycerophosphate synthase